MIKLNARFLEDYMQSDIVLEQLKKSAMQKKNI